MNLLDRYVIRAVLGGVFVVLAVLAGAECVVPVRQPAG